MKHFEPFIKHELLNIFTVMSHLLAKDKKNSKIKQQLRDLISLSSLLVSHAEVFSGISPKFFLQKNSLNELLETSLYVLQEGSFSGKKIKMFSEKIHLRLDRYYFGEVFRELLKKLLRTSDSVQLEFHEHALTLVFHHHGKKILPRERSFQNVVNSKNRTKGEISFRLALRILELSKVQIKEESGKISLIFPESFRP